MLTAVETLANLIAPIIHPRMRAGRTIFKTALNRCRLPGAERFADLIAPAINPRKRSDGALLRVRADNGAERQERTENKPAHRNSPFPIGGRRLPIS